MYDLLTMTWNHPTVVNIRKFDTEEHKNITLRPHPHPVSRPGRAFRPRVGRHRPTQHLLARAKLHWNKTVAIRLHVVWGSFHTRAAGWGDRRRDHMARNAGNAYSLARGGKGLPASAFERFHASPIRDGCFTLNHRGL